MFSKLMLVLDDLSRTDIELDEFIQTAPEVYKLFRVMQVGI